MGVALGSVVGALAGVLLQLFVSLATGAVPPPEPLAAAWASPEKGPVPDESIACTS